MKNILWAIRWSVLFMAVLFTVNGAQAQPPGLGLDPVAWNNPEILAVKGRFGLLINQKLSFGTYTTQRVARSWTKGSSWTLGPRNTLFPVPAAAGIISLNHISRKQTLRFATVSANGQTADVYAVTRVVARELQSGSPDRSLTSVNLDLLFNRSSGNLFYVQVYLDGNTTPWQMVLDNELAQWKPGEYMGIIQGPGGKYFQIRPVSKVQGKNGIAYDLKMGAVGFEFLTPEGEPLAAVSLIDRGRVYFNNVYLKPGERFLLENLAAALLLQEQI